MDRQAVARTRAVAFFDEFNKIAATVLMKQLSPAAKKFMERMTGAARGSGITQPRGARRLRQALTSSGTPQMTTELTGQVGQQMGAKRLARQHFEGVLQQQGRVYKGVPGLEQRLSKIPGHPRELTRTGAEVGGMTSAGGTAAAAPAAKRKLRAAQSLGTAPTAMAPPAMFAPTRVAAL